MARANRSKRKSSGAQIGYEPAIGDEVTGIDPALLESESESDDADDLALDGLYVDDIPRESRAAHPAPGGESGKKKKKKKKKSSRGSRPPA